MSTFLQNWLIRRAMSAPKAGGAKEYISFVDPAVEAICVANWSSDGIGLTYGDAAAVTNNDFNGIFSGNTSIVSFNEFQYFTQVNGIGYQFSNCTNLQSIICGSDNVDSHAYAFVNCSSLRYIEFKEHVDTLGDQTFGGDFDICTVVFRSPLPPEYVYNTACWSATCALTIYVPYSADHSVLSAYQTALSAIANYQGAVVALLELNPDGTIPTT